MSAGFTVTRFNYISQSFNRLHIRSGNIFLIGTYGSKLFDNKFSYLLGKLSLPIYLCQLIPITVIPEYYGSLPMKQQMIMAFVSTILLALAVSGLSKLMAIGKRSRNIENQSK